MIENDSVFNYKVPLQIVNGRKLYSSSDGAYYYFYGTIKEVDKNKIAYMKSYNCDYCGQKVQVDSISGFGFPIPYLETLKLNFTFNKIQIGKIVYKKIKFNKNDYFPRKSSFYLDSNSISRRNPKGQYKLISQGIKSFLQTKELKLDNDTLRICSERYDDYPERSVIETLDENQIKLDLPNIKLKFYSKIQLEELLKIAKKPIRILKIDDIKEYWYTTRISLEYAILLSKNIHSFKEKEFNNSFEYKKVKNGYKLNGFLPKNSWGIVDQK